MKVRYYVILLVVMISSSHAQCLKDDSKLQFTLPPATQSGSNNFGFELTGFGLTNKIWTNYGSVCFIFSGCRDNLIAYYFPTDNGGIEVRADRVLKNKGAIISAESFGFSINKNVSSIGIYHIISGDTAYDADASFRHYDTTNRKDETYLSSFGESSFTVNIKRLDTTNKILSGTFEGTLYKMKMISGPVQLDYNDSIIIKEGRFDIKMPY